MVAIRSRPGEGYQIAADRSSQLPEALCRRLAATRLPLGDLAAIAAVGDGNGLLGLASGYPRGTESFGRCCWNFSRHLHILSLGVNIRTRGRLLRKEGGFRGLSG